MYICTLYVGVYCKNDAQTMPGTRLRCTRARVLQRRVQSVSDSTNPLRRRLRGIFFSLSPIGVSLTVGSVSDSRSTQLLWSSPGEHPLPSQNHATDLISHATDLISRN